MRKKNYPRALEYFHRAIRARVDRTDLYLERANVYFVTKKYENCIIDCTIVVLMVEEVHTSQKHSGSYIQALYLRARAKKLCTFSCVFLRILALREKFREWFRNWLRDDEKHRKQKSFWRMFQLSQVTLLWCHDAWHLPFCSWFCSVLSDSDLTTCNMTSRHLFEWLVAHFSVQWTMTECIQMFLCQHASWHAESCSKCWDFEIFWRRQSSWIMASQLLTCSCF